MARGFTRFERIHSLLPPAKRIRTLPSTWHPRRQQHRQRAWSTCQQGGGAPAPQISCRSFSSPPAWGSHGGCTESYCVFHRTCLSTLRGGKLDASPSLRPRVRAIARREAHPHGHGRPLRPICRWPSINTLYFLRTITRALSLSVSSDTNPKQNNSCAVS